MNDSEKKELWMAYFNDKRPELRERLIIEYFGLVKTIAGKLAVYLGGNVEYDDLCGYGIFGLIDAIDKYDMEKDVKFETYASIRIRGAIFDHIRKLDWIPRSIRNKQKTLENARQKIENNTGSTPTDEQLMKELNIDEKEYKQLLLETDVDNIASLDGFMESDEINSEPSDSREEDHPDAVLEKKELRALLLRGLDTLKEQEKKVLMMYYYENMTLKEISKVLGLTESRISQVHSKALQKMKKVLGDSFSIFPG